MGFKKDFVWGVATSSYQIEGAAFKDGKGLSIWDVYTHTTDNIFEGQTGDVACDHCRLFREDVALMAKLGVNGYRFSVSWPRVLPMGCGAVNEKGMAFYSDLVDELLKYGIEPYITLYHWDQPDELYKRGGWLNPESPKWFGEYAGLIASRLGDRVKHFITFNEPQVFIGLAFVEGSHAPGYKLRPRDTLLMAHHVMLAHGYAAQAIRAAAGGAQVGYAPTSNAPVPVTDTPADIEAARRAYFEIRPGTDWSWNAAWWSDPIMLGSYPEDGLKLLEKDMPKITDADMKTIHQRPDFYGQNIYRGVPVRAAENGWESIPYPPGSPKTAIGWHVDFNCLYWGTKFLYQRYGAPVVITENGMSATDWPDINGEINDTARIDYLHRNLRSLRRAAESGVDVAGYFEWSFMDNFEWNKGYSDRFGLVYVDYATQERIPKASFGWYKNTIASNGDNL